MKNLGVMIIAIILSRLIFSFLFFILNNKVLGIFKSMQGDLANLKPANKWILNFAGHILSLSVTICIVIGFDTSRVVAGSILGFFSALIDICFGDSIIGNTSQKSK